MSKLFEKVQPAIKEETKNLSIVMGVFLVLMIVVFLVLHLFWPQVIPFDYSVILGGIGGTAVAILNFFLMGITIQDVLQLTNEDSAKSQMKASYTFRTLMQMLWVVAAILAPCFQTAAGIIPLFFPGTWFKIRGIAGK